MSHLDQHMLDGLTLLGLVGSVIGALFILYDLLGRPGGPLRWLLRIGIPTLIGGAIGAVITAPIGLILLHGVAANVIIFEVAMIGALIGTLNGLLVDDPDMREQQRRLSFSLVDLALGAGVALAYMLVVEIVEWRVLGVAGKSALSDLITAIPVILCVAFAGSIWRSVNRRHFGTVEAPLPGIASRSGDRRCYGRRGHWRGAARNQCRHHGDRRDADVAQRACHIYLGSAVVCRAGGVHASGRPGWRADRSLVALCLLVGCLPSGADDASDWGRAHHRKFLGSGDYPLGWTSLDSSSLTCRLLDPPRQWPTFHPAQLPRRERSRAALHPGRDRRRRPRRQGRRIRLPDLTDELT